MKSINYGRHEILDEDIQAVVEVLKSDFLTQGPAVENFENKFSEYIHVNHAIAVINGTAALHLAALALGVRAGHKILVATNTFVASANCIRYCGGDVEFVDIDAKTLCLDFLQLEQKLKKSRPGTYTGVVVVDFAGYPADTERLRAIADRYSLWILEDACHALGAKFRNSSKKWITAGDCHYADISVFSFHPVKHIATGEGGMVTTNKADLAEKVRLLRTHGITKNSSKMAKSDGAWYYEMQELGYNYRIPDVLCALGISQLRRIDSNLERRQAIAKRYSQELSGIEELRVPTVSDNFKHSYHLYVVHTQRREDLFSYLKEKQINAQVHYIPVHQQPYYEELYGKAHLPIAEEHYKTALSLPMYHGLTSDDQTKVIKAVLDFFK